MSCYFFIIEECFLRLLHSTEFLLIRILFIGFICILFTCLRIIVSRGAQNTFLLLLLHLPHIRRPGNRLHSWTLHQLILHLCWWWSLGASWSLASGCSLWTLDLFLVLFLITHWWNGSYVYFIKFIK